jgi:CTD small phosphatase-like protein 2
LLNGIPIIPFYEYKDDQELKWLEHFILNEILPANDVRKVIKDYFKLSRYLEFSTSLDAVRNLYK